MKEISVADVGDGLCCNLQTIFNDNVQLDCGSNRAEDAFHGFRWILNHSNRPHHFILSHFHKDHYNGLLYNKIYPRYFPFNIRYVYYPIIPEFKRRDEFANAIFCMNARLLGDNLGVMEYDLLDVITKLNLGYRPHNMPLSKGMQVHINGTKLEILWPPQKIEQKSVLKVIDNALTDFSYAIEEDEGLRELYNIVREEGKYRSYYGDEEEEFNEDVPYVNDDYFFKRRETPKMEPSPAINKANNSLRKAANHLSLSFFVDNRILFLGDLESTELRIVMGDILAERMRFYFLITPHHGTHYHRSMDQLHCEYAISSTGKRLSSKINPQYKVISRNALSTWVNGHIKLEL